MLGNLLIRPHTLSKKDTKYATIRFITILYVLIYFLVGSASSGYHT